jgi:hypothetical protein
MSIACLAAAAWSCTTPTASWAPYRTGNDQPPIFNDAQVCRDGLEWRAATYPVVQDRADLNPYPGTERLNVDDWRGIPETLPIHRVTVWDNSQPGSFPGDIEQIPQGLVLGTAQPAYRLDPIRIDGLNISWPSPIFAYSVVHRFLFPRLMNVDDDTPPDGNLGVAYAGRIDPVNPHQPDVNYFSVEDCVLIDAVPGSADNRVDAGAPGGFIDIAILGAPAFSVGDIDRGSIRAQADDQSADPARRGAPLDVRVVRGLSGYRGSSLLLRFRLHDIGLVCSSKRITVTARTERGSDLRPRITGHDELTPVGCD